MDFTLCLTHDCNLRCKYCYAGRKFRKRMSWATARRAVDFAVEQTLAHATPREIKVGFFGGEPLLEWDRVRQATTYLEGRAAESGIRLKLTLTTNATRLGQEQADYLRDHDFYVGLSIDGNQAMHDATRRFRNGRGSHACAIRALRYYRGPHARGEVIVTIDPDNVRHLADSVRWLAAQDICNISLNPDFYTEWPEPALASLRKGYAAAAQVYVENFRKPRYFRVNFIDGKIKTRLRQGYRACDRCSFGDREIAVAPSGNIYPCERLVAEDDNEAMRIGNVFEGFDLKRRLELLSQRGNRNPECRKCALRERCMNWCGCINYGTTGAINRVDGLVCFHEQMAIKLADEVAATLYSEANPCFLAKFYDDTATG